MSVRWYAAAETHNTPRAASREGGASYSAAVWTLLRMLPTGLPFVCAGFELGEITPINTGLGFTSEELTKYNDNSLPLFSDVRLAWDTPNHVDHVIRALEQRLQASSWYALSSDDDEIVPMISDNDVVVGYVRHTPSARRGVVVVGNLSKDAVATTITLPPSIHVTLIEPNDAVTLINSDTLRLTLEAWTSHMLFCTTSASPTIPSAPVAEM